MRSLTLGELVPSAGENVGRLPEQRGEERLLLQSCEAVEARIAGVTILPEPFGESEAKKVRSLH